MNIGIIGAGNIARKMAYTLNQMQGVNCYGIASREKERAQKFAQEFNVKKSYGSYESLVQDENIDIVYIATPHSHHYEQAKLCLNHGKAVICEKSFMANAIQTQEILELSKKKNVFITEAIWTRYLPSRKIIEDIIASGEIGEVTSLTANLGYCIKDVPRIKDPSLAGGALLDVGIYPLHFASMFLGNEIEEVTSTCLKSDTGVDMQNAIILKYKNGKLATLHSSALSATEQYGIIYGTKGYIIAENINNIDAIKIYSPERKCRKELQVPKQISGFEYQVEESIKAIKNHEIECSQIPHCVILNTMKLMDQLRCEWGIKYPFE